MHTIQIIKQHLIGYAQMPDKKRRILQCSIKILHLPNGVDMEYHNFFMDTTITLVLLDAINLRLDKQQQSGLNVIAVLT